MSFSIRQWGDQFVIRCTRCEREAGRYPKSDILLHVIMGVRYECPLCDVAYGPRGYRALCVTCGQTGQSHVAGGCLFGPPVERGN